ncbi:Inner spore coat protein H [Gemmata obscuriglobus]|uniref:CotH kinase family protein n=1 Tax=Gemmata obscuriglobus TaxID=114 RepID=UPI00016C4C85|nr:CotH kinase family protein [Gemmata obscuriglobus]QEG31430.1 Inner spore coat protein H [Gemmata obscuriglobus]VTS10772.1 Spore coat protein H OS=Sorangium cellulosum (strain So ce56) GN=sce7841 PE=4 SV=1: CotH [Gemmata obscuriglobus UQM 2246]
MKRIISAVVLGACALAVAHAPAAEVPPAPRVITDRDALFRKPQVLDLVITLDKKETEALQRDPRKYVKCLLKDGKDEYVDVGIHLKGAAGSYRDFNDKPGLTLNVDKFTDAQRYRGMEKLHLANSAQDPSFLSELICGEMFRAAGVPASRISFAKLTLNGRSRGLYYIKEGYDKTFLKENFGSSNGNFYDGGFLREIDQPLEVNPGKGDVKDHADLKALWAAVREPNERKRFEKLEKLLDLDRFISYMVIEMITSDWDGYPSKCNNYRIYHDPKTNKITFIPSGMDQMFHDINWPIMPDWGGGVARELMNTKEGKKRYLARLREIMDKKIYNPVALIRRLDELEAVVQPALATVDRGAARDYKNQVNRLRFAIKEREKIVNDQIKRLPPEK